MAAVLPDVGKSILPRLGLMLRQGDIMLAVGVIAILVVLILPLPAFLLDVCLALSVTLSVLILLTALLIEKPLDFSAFPTVLLIATMLRLALNLASTRLILGDGHLGPGAAGHVIESFGRFVMQGNLVVRCRRSIPYGWVLSAPNAHY
jgi:flagellar biosynthesis protein FlhA